MTFQFIFIKAIRILVSFVTVIVIETVTTMRRILAKSLHIDIRKAALIPDLHTLHKKETNKRVLEKVVEGEDEFDELDKAKFEKSRDELLHKKD